MNISVIFTGGTIGSVQKDAWVGVDESTQYTLLQPFQTRYEEICFTTGAPYNILSENLSADQLNLLQKEVWRVLQEKPDGIIITHGTDTLQYAATAIEYAFGDAEIPIVFVSADYPLEDPKSNGYVNFEAAVEFILHSKQAGVYVSYKNEDKACVDFHVASRLLQHNEASANLYSLQNVICATYENELCVCNSIPASGQSIGVASYLCNPGILTVESVPGNHYRYDLEGVQAILLKPYHSATLNTDNEAFVTFCRQAQAKKIPIFISNVPKGEQYESSKSFAELGIRVAPYSTFVALYMKLWLGISLKVDLGAFVDQPICREIG